jgi:flagellar assembly factor FliW
MRIASRRFGEIEVPARHVLRVQGGILPFPGEEYAIISRKGERPFAWLQSVSDPGLAFVVVQPQALYGPEVLMVGNRELHQVGLKPGDEVLVLCLVTAGDQVEQDTVNLLAPLIVNPQTGGGKQAILEGDLRLLQTPLGLAAWAA